MGVDPENVNQNVNVGHNNGAIADDFEDEENLFDDDDYSDFDDDVHEVIPSLTSLSVANILKFQTYFKKFFKAEFVQVSFCDLLAKSSDRHKIICFCHHLFECILPGVNFIKIVSTAFSKLCSYISAQMLIIRTLPFTQYGRQALS